MHFSNSSVSLPLRYFLIKINQILYIADHMILMSATTTKNNENLYSTKKNDGTLVFCRYIVTLTLIKSYLFMRNTTARYLGQSFERVDAIVYCSLYIINHIVCGPSDHYCGHSTLFCLCKSTKAVL